MVTQERLKYLFSYNAETGHLIRKVSTSSNAIAGNRSGSLDNGTGYRRLRLDSKIYQEHRIIWLLVKGSFPPDYIDHINGVKDDNRLCNLREATNAENQYNQGNRSNNTSGFKGVSYHKRSGKYIANITIHGHQKYLGLHETIKEAHTAYCEASLKYHKEFSRTN